MSSSSSSIRASIIICTYNRASTVDHTLKKLNEFYNGRKDIEVILIDNNSTDHTKEIASKYPHVLYFLEKNQGLSWARNRGINESQGDIIIFLDDDAVPLESSWLDAYISFFVRNDDCFAAGGEVLPNFEITPPEWIYTHCFFTNSLSILKFEESRAITESEWLVGANVAYRKQLFHEIGLFNTELGRVKNNLMSNDEIDIQRKAESKNLTFYYLKGAPVFHLIHKERLNINWFKKRMFWQGRSNRILHPNQHLPLKMICKSFLKFLNPFGPLASKLDFYYILGYYSKIST